MKKITYEYKESLNTDQKQIIIKGIYKGSKLDSFLSGSINDSITTAIKTDSFNGDYGKNIPVYTNTNISALSLKHGKLMKSIVPKKNRAVIFDTSKNSWHAVNKINNNNIYRKSMAVYYFTKHTQNQYLKLVNL